MGDKMISPAEFAGLLNRTSDLLPARIEGALHTLGKHIAREAAGYIGVPRPEWRPLSPATEARKAEEGYPTGAPLLRTSEMKNSIDYNVTGHKLTVGSTEKYAPEQELGTSRIPPRPFLSLAMNNSMDYAGVLFGTLILQTLQGRVGDFHEYER